MVGKARIQGVQYLDLGIGAYSVVINRRCQGIGFSVGHKTREYSPSRVSVVRLHRVLWGRMNDDSAWDMGPFVQGDGVGWVAADVRG